MNWLMVGDLHAKKNNLEESEAIIDWSIKLAQEKGANLVLLGDTLNDFGVLRVEALLFFNRIFEKFKVFNNACGGTVVILKGNHDENSQGTMTYLELWENRHPFIQIVTSTRQDGNVLFVPFIRDNAQFKATLEAYPSADTLVCHQEFDGCMYENGFYSPHGFKAEDLPANLKAIWSGHIHKTQYLGSAERPIGYIGIPRHLTKSDLGHTPVVALTSDYRTVELIEVPKDIAIRFQSLTITEATTKPELKELMTTTDRSRFYIEITGPEVFIRKLLRSHDWSGFKVKTSPTDKKQVTGSVKESEGIRTSFSKYTFSYADKNGLGTQEVKAINELFRELIPEFV